VVQRAIRGAQPAEYMSELGFGPLELVKEFPVMMSGKGAIRQPWWLYEMLLFV
jgi:hypothetical protein